MKTHHLNPKRRQIVLATAGAVLSSMAGCGGGGGGDGGMTGGMNGPGNPPATGAAASLPAGAAFTPPTRLANLSATPGNFKAALSAAPTSIQLATAGAATTVWAFNGLSPGPLIEVQEGDSVRISFTNRLSQSSTIHWHGLPVPPDQDGNPMDPVPPGASRTYAFTLPPGCAGTYWYHPHTHETTHEQVFRGLAGCLIVRPAVDPLAGITERVMMVTDLRLDAGNQIAANTTQDNTFGREGDHLLVNGAKLPTLSVQPGATERWRIINATNARYLRLALTGHTLRIAGFDGGLIEQLQTVNEVLLAPAQRLELIIQASTQANQSFTLRARSYSRGMMMSSSVETSLLTLRTSVPGAAAPVAIPALLRAVPALPAPVRTQSVVLSDTMGMGMMGMQNAFLINGRAFDPARTDLVARVNDIEDWLIANQGGMDHPFHIHGTQFQLVGSTRGDTTPAPGIRAWIDTINIRPGETVRVRIQQTMPGKRMFHCHILEHEDQGMMAVLEVRAG